MQKVIGFVPARGGSKGLPGKNIKPLNGKPLLAYTIEAALNSQVLDQVLVSSDDDAILDVAVNYGATCLKRDQNLSEDDTGINAVLLDFIQHQTLEPNTIIVLLQPTSPLRTSKHIGDALSWYLENSGSSLISVNKINSNVLYAFVEDQQYLVPISSIADSCPRRQDLPAVYSPNGAIYIFSVAAFLENKAIPKSKMIPFVMALDDSIDIDTEEDLRLCSHYLMNQSENI